MAKKQMWNCVQTDINKCYKKKKEKKKKKKEEEEEEEKK